MKKIISAVLSAITAMTIFQNCLPILSVNAENKETKLIALTFDDGPNVTTTNEVLDILEEYNAKASFFLIGNNINAESAVTVKRAYDMGMEIDNHSKTHSNMSKMSDEELQSEISFVDEKVNEIIGENTKFFRPPFIDVSQSMYEAIDLPFICGIDCQDYMENVSAQDRADYILNGAKDGVIVLLHDAAGNNQTVEALKIVMPQLIEQGYEFVTLTELFERQGEVPKDNILYSNVAKYPCKDYKLYKEIDSDATDRISLDKTMIADLGNSYAIELEYESATGYPPVIALQRWSSTPSIWHTIQPFYFNGNKAVFLADDISSALNQLDVDCNELDGISIAAYSGEITLKNAKFLVKSDEPQSIKGDVNNDGKFSISDVIIFQKWILAVPDAELADWKAADLCKDEELDAFDLSMMKRYLISGETCANKVYAANTDELKNALENAKAGDEIILAEGEYIYSGSTEKGYMFKSSAEGTEEHPIIIRSENPEKPAVIIGSSTSSNIAFSILGDWWEIRDLKITNAQKGIVLDNSNHTKIIGCEVYNIGSEGIHFRDNSSYCLAENCYVHDTGVVSPGYGEAVYVGSAKSTTGYGFDCNYNTISSCKLGPNVAAEHVDIKEYTVGTIVENCTFDGIGMSGENSSKSFVNIKGNDCILRNNTGYRNGCEMILRAFEQNDVVEGWGQNALVYGNKVYMDKDTGSTGKKMYFLNSWDCSVTVWDNFMAYDGELFSVDNEDDHWKYYNCNMITYGNKE